MEIKDVVWKSRMWYGNQGCGMEIKDVVWKSNVLGNDISTDADPQEHVHDDTSTGISVII